MTRVILILVILLGASNSQAEHLDLDQLLREVKQSRSAQGKVNREREARFQADKTQQQRLLAAAKSELAQQEHISAQIKTRFEANEAELTQMETVLKERTGVLGELFGVVRQVAGDLKADIDNSVVSAQFPERSQKLDTIAKSQAVPTVEQLEYLWYSLQQEMTETGKVVRFPANILAASGQPRDAQVVRIGAFNAFAEGAYLRYLPETQKLAELARQPASRYLSLAEDFAGASGGQAEVAVDPTRGVILSMLVQAPNSWERIKQGGFVGYIIIALGIIGLVIVIVRLVMLTLIKGRMDSQLKNMGNFNPDNPLGRVLAAPIKHKAKDMESLELLMDEAITREVPPLERGQSLIKLLASVAPLLGLLGTVTGMIATFQSISLFGTGDPKLMANGISQALVTTMLGLIVAIPLLFLHSLLVTRSKALIQVLDEQSVGLLARFLVKGNS